MLPTGGKEEWFSSGGLVEASIVGSDNGARNEEAKDDIGVQQRTTIRRRSDKQSIEEVL